MRDPPHLMLPRLPDPLDRRRILSRLTLKPLQPPQKNGHQIEDPPATLGIVSLQTIKLPIKLPRPIDVHTINISPTSY